MTNERIQVRKSDMVDCRQFYLWEKTKQVSQFFSIADDVSEEDIVREFVLNDVDDEKEQYTILGSDGRMLGRIYLAGLSRKLDSLEIYRIYIGDPKERDKGFGRQAIEWILSRAFDDDSFHRVYLDYYTGNPAAFLYESMGFQHEGIARDACKKMGKYYDTHIMSMLRADYDKLYKGKK